MLSIMNTVSRITQDPEATLSISDLAARTGVTATTVRTWETRHGFPEPVRLPGRHRRYSEDHVSLVKQVLQRRADGLTLEAAIAEAQRDGSRTPVDRSIYAGLRRLHPHLAPQILRKSTLLALTHAIEDECCARAENPLLVASFQHERYFDRARARYRDLTRTSRSTVVFANFADAPKRGREDPTVIHVPVTAPMRREWTLICDAPDYPACLSAWELPGQEGKSDADRLFEAIWSLEPGVVRDASRIGLQLAHQFSPEEAEGLPEPPTWNAPPASPDLIAATSLFGRLLAYLERS